MARGGGAPPSVCELDGPASPFGQVPAPLLRGTDFDVVVLGISVGALPALCQDRGQANQAFGDMLLHGKTMPTRAIQCWLTRVGIVFPCKSMSPKAWFACPRSWQR